MVKSKDKFDNLFIYVFVSFLISVVLYIVVGARLSIEYLVSVSLVVIGAAWSYLAIEVNQVKQLRDEYIKKINDVEGCSWKLIDESIDIFTDIVYFKNIKKVKIFFWKGDEFRIKKVISLRHTMFFYTIWQN